MKKYPIRSQFPKVAFDTRSPRRGDLNYFSSYFSGIGHPELSHIERELMEVYKVQSQRSKLNTDLNFIVDVALLLRPALLGKPTCTEYKKSLYA